ncbi:hypothetical protein LG296_19955 (plasmid) [Ureibacillus chungkukjangi]|uniref:IS66 family insertion sequence element accessory protein TnpA n=1 Tax=Ureibacillus chungkukjangi TaxID=1202712 RepID=UPI000D3799D1|nr:hypothetical protein [Ureibacillus chungkukjangi]MCM3390712.1 hypothetical protein [Ureibacillus chungkukjangi]HCG4536310.1 hypothetical protein [Salmonella enterica subsp. enterica serovar Typhi str. AG3]
MSPEERRQLWQQRIDAYKVSGEPNVKAWCHKNQVGLQSMYQWMKRLHSESSIDVQPATQWMELSQSSSHSGSNSSLRIHIGNVSIEIQDDFNRTLFQEVIEILQHHVK